MFDILTYGFIQRALLTGVIIGVACSMLGLFLVLRRYSLFGDALAHTALTGIAMGIFLNVYPLLIALVTSTLASLGIAKLRSSIKIQGDVLIAILLIAGVASAVVLLSISKNMNVSILSYLFGSILLISSEDILVVLIAGLAAIASIIVYRDKLLHITIDEDQARISGINVGMMNYFFMVLASIIIIIAIRLVGILLVSSIIVLPNVAAMMLGAGFKRTLLVSPCIAVASVIMGVLISYNLDIAVSGMIVMMNLIIIAGIVMYTKVRSKSKGKGNYNGMIVKQV